VILSWKPTPRQSVTDWCEQHLLLTGRQTKHPGPYSTANRPYVREPLECWRDPSVTDVVLCWGSQTSKTTTLMAGLCWLIDNEPSPVLWLMPTELLARSFSRTRWMPFLEESRVMRRHFPDDRKKITLLEQHFDRCTLTFVGSNSPANLASRPIRILVADEVDKFAAATSREAAALELALQRTKSYSSSKFRLPLLEFNGDFLLDILAKLRKGPEGAGGFRWELTGQTDEEYFRHLDAKVKKPEVIGRSGKVQVIWRLRSRRWPDHLLDCELEQLAMAMIHRRLPWATIAQPEKEEETA